MRGSPEKEGDIIWRGRNRLRILNTRVLLLTDVDGELSEGEQRGWCCCSRKVRRGMCLMTALPARHKLFMGRCRVRWKELWAGDKEAGV